MLMLIFAPLNVQFHKVAFVHPIPYKPDVVVLLRVTGTPTQSGESGGGPKLDAGFVQIRKLPKVAGILSHWLCAFAVTINEPFDLLQELVVKVCQTVSETGLSMRNKGEPSLKSKV